MYENETFIKNITKYNAQFSMVTHGCQTLKDKASPVHKIHGTVHHCIRSIVPFGFNKNEHKKIPPSTYYIYRYDPKLQNEIRNYHLQQITQKYTEKKKKEMQKITEDLTEWFNKNNPHCKKFITAYQLLELKQVVGIKLPTSVKENVVEQSYDIELVEKKQIKKGEHIKQYSLPTSDNIALIVNRDNEDQQQSLIIDTKQGLCWYIIFYNI